MTNLLYVHDWQALQDTQSILMHYHRHGRLRKGFS